MKISDGIIFYILLLFVLLRVHGSQVITDNQIPE